MNSPKIVLTPATGEIERTLDGLREHRDFLKERQNQEAAVTAYAQEHQLLVSYLEERIHFLEVKLAGLRNELTDSYQLIRTD